MTWWLPAPKPASERPGTYAVVVEHPGYRWVTPAQLTELLRHSHYVNIQTRSLLACLRSEYAP